MKKLFVIALMLSLQTFGMSTYIDAAANSIGTSYTTSFPNLALSKSSLYPHTLYVFNGCSTTLAFNAYNGSNAGVVAPSSTCTQNCKELFVPANTGVILDNAGPGTYVYVRSVSVACANGIVIAETL